MAMVITKFNKLIANKFIWIGFTILIVLAFVVWDMSIPEEARDGSQAAPATLYGKPVSPDEFRAAYVHTYMSVVLSMGQNIQITPEVDAELTDMAWKRLVSLKEANKLGLAVSNREVVEAIRNFGGFQQNNQFSPAIYQSFVQQFLPNLGFSAAQFEDHVRQELVLQQLQRMVAETVLVTPAEIERAIRSFGDSFTVEYALIDETVLGEGLVVSDEKLEAFFENNQERFATAPKVQVRYVRFAIADYEADVEITEAQALDYYDLNIEQYTRVEEPVEAEEEEQLFAVTTTLPFEDVQEEIIATLRRETAAHRTADVAMDFVISLVPDRLGNALAFDEAANSLGLEILQTEPFARGAFLPDIDAGLAFTSAAFDLRPGPEFYFSDAITGRDYIYVLALEERFPSYLPELEEVREAVLAAAQASAIQDAMEELARSLKEAAEADTFAAAADQLLIQTRGPVEFTAAAGLSDVDYGQDLLRAVLNFNQGEVTEPVKVSNGYLVAFVTGRVAADPAEYADFRPQIIVTIAGERSRILFDEWQEQLLRQADFQPRVIPERIPDEEEDDEWALVR